ncbi:DUF350 domain-containing protein [Flammeovirga pectinis]|uniref:DUF350 domain-containing protein n=1 Tax=Flammeovirga pectinis TaxID=2494373 RepID=A0A3Q9FQZ4_9BACT|nr:DUF350 domain-containing protein [Flammeovirga pectinis]AZQ62704.1 DUF350 domain-containing protein [Flammeovirga pectinis]
MRELIHFDLEQWGVNLIYVVLFSVVLAFARVFKGLVVKDDVNKELTEKDNVAYGVSMAGYFLGVSIVYIGAMIGPSNGLMNDVIAVLSYSIGGIIAMLISRIINDKLIFSHIVNVKEIVDNRNVSIGLIQTASYVASGLMIASAISGEGGGPVNALVFYLVGQAFLVLYTKGYINASTYNIQEELKAGNLAIAFSVTGKMLAIGLIVMTAIGQEFMGWKQTFLAMFIDGGIMIVLLFLASYLFDKVIIPKSALRHELVEDKNVGIGVLDCCANVMFACLMVFLL